MLPLSSSFINDALVKVVLFFNYYSGNMARVSALLYFVRDLQKSTEFRPGLLVGHNNEEIKSGIC